MSADTPQPTHCEKHFITLFFCVYMGVSFCLSCVYGGSQPCPFTAKGSWLWWEPRSRCESCQIPGQGTKDLHKPSHGVSVCRSTHSFTTGRQTGRQAGRLKHFTRLKTHERGRLTKFKSDYLTITGGSRSSDRMELIESLGYSTHPTSKAAARSSGF